VRLGRFVVALTVAFVLARSGVPPAFAGATNPVPDPPPPHDIDVSQGEHHAGDTGGGSGGGSHGPVCVWRDATPEQVDDTANNAGPGGRIVRDEAGDPGIQVLICDGTYDGHTWRLKPQPVTPQELASRAYVELQRDLPQPSVHTTPEDGHASIATVPVFVWLDAGQWTPRHYTETDPSGSGLSITATATPTTMAFDPGDGSPIIQCAGPAVAYDPGLDSGDPFAQAARSGRCTHPYARITRNADATPVPGRPNAWPALLDVTWGVTWAATNGVTGTLPPIAKATGFDRPVTEIQVLVTG
jgi:hypothetical protein